jgi:hypothetical protein
LLFALGWRGVVWALPAVAAGTFLGTDERAALWNAVRQLSSQKAVRASSTDRCTADSLAPLTAMYQDATTYTNFYEFGINMGQPLRMR